MISSTRGLDDKQIKSSVSMRVLGISIIRKKEKTHLGFQIILIQ